MPAAAVIPALIAYIKVVAVKKLVVGNEKTMKGSILTDFVLFLLLLSYWLLDSVLYWME